MFNSLLVAVDGSEHSRKALQVACELLKSGDSKLHILHIPQSLAHEALLVWGIGAVPLEANQEDIQKAGRQIIEKAKANAQELGVSQVETTIGQGEPARTILNQAEQLGVDAIVLGSRGLGDLAGLVMGSVSHKVTHSAKCTVITVR